MQFFKKKLCPLIFLFKDMRLKDKLFETMTNIQDMLDISNVDISGATGENSLPKPEDIHNHLNSLLGGKIGGLAKEIAEETVSDMNLKVDDDADPEELAQLVVRCHLMGPFFAH